MKESFYSQIKDILSKSLDSIFIIGKGSSADNFDFSNVSENSLVININDSERIYPGEIAIFHSDWVLPSIEENGFKSKLYISPFNLSDYGVNHLIIPKEDNDQDVQDLLFQRLLDESLSIENYIFTSALKVANIIASQKNKVLKVYLIGFDFDIDKGYSNQFKKNYNQVSEFSSVIIKSQSRLCEEILSKDIFSNINIYHIGSLSFSSSFEKKQIKVRSKNNFKFNYSLSLKEKYKDLITSKKVIITAELTTNHFGNISSLKSMVIKAKESGADMVKVQKRDVENFYSKDQLNSEYISPFGNTFRDYRNELELDNEGFYELNKVCEQENIPWFASVLDINSFEYILSFGCPLIKAPSTISNKKTFLDHLAKNYTGDIVISTGMTDQKYEDFILDNFSECNKIFLLQCNSAYPSPPEECNVAVISRYAEYSKSFSNVIPGYSSHDIGYMASCMAISAGAKMIEKHVKLRSNDWSHFDSVALELHTDEFKDFVSQIRLAEKIYGSSRKKINLNEHHKY